MSKFLKIVKNSKGILKKMLLEITIDFLQKKTENFKCSHKNIIFFGHPLQKDILATESQHYLNGR